MGIQVILIQISDESLRLQRIADDWLGLKVVEGKGPGVSRTSWDQLDISRIRQDKI